MKQTVRVELSPRQVIATCRIVYAATAQLRQELGQTSGLMWEQLPERTRIEVETGVRDISTGRVKSPPQMHERWRDAMIKDGWTSGLVIDRENKKHPAICAFDELPILEQAKYNLFWSVAQTMIFHYATYQALGGDNS